MPAAFALTARAGDEQNLLLNRFHDDFSMKGERGGLFSMEWNFLPAPGAARDEAAMEAALGVHVDMLDRVFASVLSGKREDSLMDIPGRRKVGYDYQGSMTSRGARRARRRLGKLFGPEAARADPRPVESGIAEASVQWQRDRSKDEDDDTGLKVTHRLGHAVNVCLFRHLRAGDGFELSAEAELQTRALADLLLELQKGWLPTARRDLAGA